MDTSAYPVFSGTFEIIIGTYEEFVLGYEFKDELKELKESFSAHSHLDSVRCVATSENYAASGGTDENIHIYDMVNRKGSGTIMQHNGTITSLKFTPENGHLMSCSQDGSIAIFRVGSWQPEKVWTAAHKGAGVHCLDVHPSSKLALSLGQNKTLRTWNLVKGRPAYTSNLASLGKYMDTVVWSSRGTYFAVPADNKIHVFNIDVAGIMSTVQCNSRITSISFIQDDIVCFGEEGGTLICYNITLKSELWREKVSESRIKCISSVLTKWIVTACSDGQIAVWEMSNVNTKPVLLSSTNTGCRITCMDIRIPMKIEDS